MLMTGRDNHEVALGSIPEVLAPNMRRNPAYSMRWPDGLPTIASRLRNAGYQTFVTGKWGIGDIGKNLPDRFGFDRSFVIDATGGSNYDHTPYLALYEKTEWFEDGEPITLPDGFYSSEGIVDRMITYLDEADPDKPFFSYLSFQAIHFPVQVGSSTAIDTLVVSMRVGRPCAPSVSNAPLRSGWFRRAPSSHPCLHHRATGLI